MWLLLCSYYFGVFGFCCIVSFSSSLAPSAWCWRSCPISAIPPGQWPRGSGWVSGQCPRGSGWWGMARRISGLPGQLRHGAGMGRDVANAWHSSCISGTAPRLRGNQKYLVPREARRVTGTGPALSEEALSLQSWAQPCLQLRCEHGAGSCAGGEAPAGGWGKWMGCSHMGISSHGSFYTKAKVITQINGLIIIIALIASFIHGKFSTTQDKGSVLSCSGVFRSSLSAVSR